VQDLVASVDDDPERDETIGANPGRRLREQAVDHREDGRVPADDERDERRGGAADGGRVGPEDSYPNYLDYARQLQTVRSLLAYQFERFALETRDATYGVNGALVSTNYFDTLGLRLASGRPFTEGENRLDSSGLVAIVSHRFWVSRLGSAPDVIGQSIVLNGHPATVVGVAPPRFHGATLAESADVWVPLLSYARASGRERALDDRGGSPSIMIGQLAPQASLAQARAELATISARLRAAYPDTNRNRTAAVFPCFMLGTGSFAYQGPTDVPTYLGVFGILAAASLAACYLPARQAARVDPIEALRHE
jgi:hypothetical protein